jgi:hypothetical protein
MFGYSYKKLAAFSLCKSNRRLVTRVCYWCDKGEIKARDGEAQHICYLKSRLSFSKITLMHTTCEVSVVVQYDAECLDNWL